MSSIVTSLSTIVKGELRYLANTKRTCSGCLKDDIDAGNVYLSETPTQITIKVSPNKKEKNVILDFGLKKTLHPWYGFNNIVTGNKLHSQDVRDKSNDKEWKARTWIYEWVGEGFHIIHSLDETLYLGVRDDGSPTLSFTPTLWEIPEEQRFALVSKKAEHLFKTGSDDAVANWFLAEKSLFDISTCQSNSDNHPHHITPHKN